LSWLCSTKQFLRMEKSLACVSFSWTTLVI